MKKEVAETIRSIFSAIDLNAAQEQIAKAIEKYSSQASKMVGRDLTEGINVFSLASHLWI
ncbi:hypothetical protein [Rubritalea sp.]|uniref:hypothetical protein n=1 Tax=Rubritalea sp. TaxID=2109375 RepID=UPI003242E965